MRILFITLVATVLAACSGKKPDEQAFKDSLAKVQTEEVQTIDGEMIASVLGSIPSPLEISVMLKESGTKYDASLLNSPDNISKYNTNYQKALNLGVYGTDLGYTNIFEQNQDGIKYLASIKSIADGLNIGQFFDIETIGHLATNSKNLDSLLLITTQNFNAINSYLQTQSRSNLSVLSLTGGWIEALHITCQVAAKTKKTDKKMNETIGEQKIILEQIVLLFSFYKDDENMASLLKDLEALKATFDKINITYTYKEPTMEVVNGVAMIHENSTTTIDITDQDIENIRNLTKSIRNKIVS